MTIFVGIDPGLTGGIGFVDSRSCVVHDIPTVALPGNGLVKRRVDGRALAELIRRYCPAGDGTPRVMLEAVQTMGDKNNAVQTQGSLMRSLGAIEAVLELLRLETTMVSPQTWKRHYGLVGAENPKAEALAKARSLWPACSDIGRAKDHNRAEALLIANYGLRRLS